MNLNKIRPNKNVRRLIFKNNLSVINRYILFYALGIKIPIPKQFIKEVSKNGYLEVLKWLRENRRWKD